MSALSWLRMARKVPGLGSQPELPHLEALIESEALKTKDEYHIARWVTPLAMTIPGLAVFIPLTVTVSPYFLFGVVGMPLVGGTLGIIFHMIARQIPQETVLLRKRCFKVMGRLNGLRNLLGWGPVLSPKVGEILDEAAELYLKSSGPSEDRARPQPTIYDEALVRAQKSMDAAMTQMLLLAEPESPQAQEAEWARGWAETLLEEMRAAAKAIEEHRKNLKMAAMVDAQVPGLAGLREARTELERLESAVSELEQEVR